MHTALLSSSFCTHTLSPCSRSTYEEHQPLHTAYYLVIMGQWVVRHRRRKIPIIVSGDLPLSAIQLPALLTCTLCFPSRKLSI